MLFDFDERDVHPFGAYCSHGPVAGFLPIDSEPGCFLSWSNHGSLWKWDTRAGTGCELLTHFRDDYKPRVDGILGAHLAPGNAVVSWSQEGLSFADLRAEVGLHLLALGGIYRFVPTQSGDVFTICTDQRGLHAWSRTDRAYGGIAWGHEREVQEPEWSDPTRSASWRRPTEAEHSWHVAQPTVDSSTR